ncbi:MAG: DUF5794 domain-containing protein [Haloarculaceae archaeon]
MSTSRHPIALRLERQVGGATKLLATVMCLPLIDGIFPALVLSGALADPLGILQVGLLIFGGSATVAVILAEMDGDRPDQVKAVLVVGAVVLSVAILEAALAPTIRSLLNAAVFERFAGLVIVTIAAKTASARVGELLPRPAVVVVLGLVASLQPGQARLAFRTDPTLMIQAGAAAGIGVLFALSVALAGPYLRNAVDIDRFRFGSAVALGVLPLTLFGFLPTEAPIALAVLGVTAVLAFDPERAREPEPAYEPYEGPDAAVSDGGDETVPDEELADAVRGGATETHTDDGHAPWM